MTPEEYLNQIEHRAQIAGPEAALYISRIIEERNRIRSLLLHLRAQLRDINIDGVDVWNYWLEDDLNKLIDEEMQSEE